jgi:hypothetical protein
MTENTPTLAGQSTRQMAADRYTARLKRAWWLLAALAGGFLLPAVILLVGLAQNGDWLRRFGLLVPLGYMVLVALFGVPIWWWSRTIPHEVSRAVRGAQAEETVGHMLAELGDGFEVLHDVPCEWGNIDHVVIGRNNSLFLIETKSHRGRVQVQDETLLLNGQPPEKDFIRQTLRNTFWLRERIRPITDSDVWITPVIVFTNAFVERSEPVQGITIINKKYLPPLLGQPNYSRQNSVVGEKSAEIAALLKPAVSPDAAF